MSNSYIHSLIHPSTHFMTLEKLSINCRRPLNLAVILSVLLHILLLLSIPLTKPIREKLEINEVLPLKEEHIVFELAEISESAKLDEPLENAKLLSDEDAQAQNPELLEEIAALNPYSDGNTEEKNIITPPESEASSSPETPETSEEPTEKISDEGNNSSPPLAHLPLSTLPNAPQINYKPPKPTYDNRESSVAALGDMSFSTLDWNFAWYARYLKETIRSNWYPPYAFWLGMIDGEVIISFIIEKDGSITNTQILSSSTHESLDQSALGAILASNVLKPLPSDFPDKNLGVTFRFIYVGKKQ